MAYDAFQKGRDLLCVEIGEAYFKAVYFRNVKGKMSIAGTAGEYEQGMSGEDTAAAIRKFAMEMKAKNPEVINVIPSKYGIYKNIEIPSVDPKEIKQIIDLQAGAHTPYPKNEIIISYSNIGILHQRYTKILLVIIKKDVVSSRYDIIRKAGFKAETALLSSEVSSGFFSAHLKDKPSKMIGLLNIDATSTDFTVIQDGRAMYIRSFALGTVDLMAKGADINNQFSEEVKKSIESYQANNVGTMPDVIYVTGALAAFGAAITQAQRLFTEATFTSMGYADIFSIPESIKDTALDTPGLSLLSVIAPSESLGKEYINLVPEEVRVRQEIKKKSREMTFIAIMAMVLMLLFCSVFIVNIFFKTLYLGNLERNYNKENMEVGKLKLVSDKTSIVKRFIEKKGEVLNGLCELINSLPKEIFLNSIGFREDGTVIFTGTAESMSQVFSLVTELENNKHFSNVKVDFTKSRRQKEQEVADFGLTLTIEQNGQPYGQTA
ncbi:MAG: pilus assembly protein PilM [Candidatus Omnitrophica bacterium]|nr:pilus assembly protein PilM [Candidatus Omnitrophota bacterium]MDD5488748.1 pilus assembly protein PilM [Candidatus Omnitrophota bacterium]